MMLVSNAPPHRCIQWWVCVHKTMCFGTTWQVCFTQANFLSSSLAFSLLVAFCLSPSPYISAQDLSTWSFSEDWKTCKEKSWKLPSKQVSNLSTCKMTKRKNPESTAEVWLSLFHFIALVIIFLWCGCNVSHSYQLLMSYPKSIEVKVHANNEFSFSF